MLVAPKNVLHVHDYDDPGKPAIAWDDADARDHGWWTRWRPLVRDARRRVLGYLPEQELGSRAAEAVALCGTALVAGQDVEPVEGCRGAMDAGASPRR